MAKAFPSFIPDMCPNCLWQVKDPLTRKVEVIWMGAPGPYVYFWCIDCGHYFGKDKKRKKKP